MHVDNIEIFFLLSLVFAEKTPHWTWIGACPAGWIESATACYKVESDMTDWATASKNCQTV